MLDPSPKDLEESVTPDAEKRTQEEKKRPSSEPSKGAWQPPTPASWLPRSAFEGTLDFTSQLLAQEGGVGEFAKAQS